MLLPATAATVSHVRPHLVRVLGFTLGAIGLVAAIWVGTMWWQSRLPDSYNVMDYGTVDVGGGTPVSHPGHGNVAPSGTVSVADLTGPSGPPDARFTLTARAASIRLPSGRAVDALTFDGTVPGPELRVRQGDLVEVTLVNEDIGSGVSIHWHGVDVPNAEDGVAGVTQDAVPPGGRHVYRFRPNRAGTFWYHTHQVAASEVRRGLFGVLVVEPREAPSDDGLDLALAAHSIEGRGTLAGSDQVEHRSVDPGTPVRLRLVDTDDVPQRFALDGVPFRVLAIDGNELNQPGALEHETLELAAGGRYDIGFTMPADPGAALAGQHTCRAGAQSRRHGRPRVVTAGA